MVRRALLVLLLAFGPAAICRAEELPEDLRIAAIRAYAYLSETGLVDSRELVTSGIALWNTPTGGGDIRSPTEITLVVVELAGKYEAERREKLVLRAVINATERSRTELPLDLYWEGESVKVPFLVYGTGCDELWLSAELLKNGKEVQFQTARVPFTCGE